jgi:hypothetical protein
MSKTTSRSLLVALCILIQVTSAYAFNAGVDPSLMAWWKLDEGSGTKVTDSSGNGNTGTTSGSPQWVAGKLGGALYFNANGYVDCGNSPSLNPTDGITICLWIKSPGFGANQWGAFVAKGDTGSSYRFGRNSTGNACHFGLVGVTASGNPYFDGIKTVADGEWHHIAATYDGAHMVIWVDDVVDNSYAATGKISSSSTKCYINENADATGRTVVATYDDVRIYNRALSEAELQIVAMGYVGNIATNPSPVDKATDVIRETPLSWSPAVGIGTHDVYLGTSFDDVNTASADSPLLVSKGQDATSYDPPSRLDFSTTYYWRVDEVNATAEHAVFKGSVWQFTTEPYAYKMTNVTATASSVTATSPAVNTVNGSGLTGDLHGTDAKTMWLSASGGIPAWIQFDFDQVYKLHQMWVWNHNTAFEALLGFGAKDTVIEYSVDGTTWTKLGDFVLDQAPGEDGIAPTSTIAFDGVAAKSVRLTINDAWMNKKQVGLSEVQFLYIPVMAREPQPATGSTGIDPTTVVLGWRTGREAASHSIYTSTDPNALLLSGTSTTNRFAPANLNLSTKYYWRVDEVNTAMTPTTWPSSVWNFTTADFLVVDDMESYNDTTNKIFDTWVDGYGTTTNGALVGYDQSVNNTFGDTTTIHGGSQSMPFRYGQNSASTSEATRTFATSQDWTAAGVKTLVLYFYGDPANTGGQLYLKINSTKVTYSGDAGNIQRHRWNQWNIDLASISGGVKAVKTLTLGVSGGAGILLVDDLLLYESAPVIATPVDPGTANLIAYYAMSNNVKDSSGKGNDGTIVGAPTYAAGLSASNTALKLNGTADCVDLGKKDVFNPTGSFSIALWANIGAWGTAWDHVMIGNRGEDNVGWQLRRYSSASFCFTTRGVGNDDMASKITPPQNEWIHFACVYDDAANTKTIYINGVLDSVVTTTAGAHIAATTHNTYIGARALAANTGPDTATFFTGMLDEIRIFNRALTAGEADFLSQP